MTVPTHKVAPEPPAACTAEGKLIPLRSDVHVKKGENAFPIWGVNVPNQYGVEHVCDPTLWKTGVFRYKPRNREERIILTLSQRLHLRTTTPSIAATVYGTITVQDIGKGLPS